ncbi:PTS lactose/cellobiose transporter subunit IIA [Aerococcaceae bacterium zg-ZJ1578]|uniref:PTS lactose/cellobiose transporter subunit IIA n=1 Tax=Aerococcaceae TaxID=186827 RepID=UPI0013BB8A61|nr:MULTISPECIES: PTS lactose/cellobiose transporter subunit IIA [unclassified Facklamia]MBK0348305.1 PTS lactose/cellobiose transporter subunit IIA [Aerococcaceae bacterium zg-1578]MBR7927580.1 PTS lactose/cellobiose transporter subunit IIA [Aerococcaceae bacterium zg-ZUI334]MBS4462131.1 PTS lactose/cellobiose transporter subunit IIA [Aerococcaceae bacterium zg-B36]QQD65404.1 PTS lactose/cellobiose transporter subunit IIA [Aerococcaceae bacterium zg-252]NEW64591.1 PTS lactose/cellobiose transp
MEKTDVIMGLIVNGGNARSLAMKAIYAAKRKEYEEAEKLLTECNEFLVKAHHAQTELLTKEAGGEKTDITLLLIHAQDHLMNAMTVKDMAIEFVELYKSK